MLAFVFSCFSPVSYFVSHKRGNAAAGPATHALRKDPT
jgi:hypothetical protein